MANKGEFQRIRGLVTKIWRPDNDRLEAVIQTADGGFAVAGSYVKSYGEQGELGRSSDAWLAKTNAGGYGLWSQTYGRFLLSGQKDDVAYSLIQTSDGGFVLAGYTGCYGAGKKDMWLIKTDSNGNPQWNQTYGGSEDDISYAIIQTTGGGFILAGSTDSYGAGKSDVWLVKTSPNGNEEWNRVYGESGADVANTMIQTTDGGYALAGWTNSSVEESSFPFPPPPSLPKTDALLMKTDANGATQWNQTYRGIYPNNKAFSVIETTNGSLIFAGQSGMDAWLVKTDTNGNMEWNQTYGGPGLDSANAIIQTPDGGYAFTGSFFSPDRVADFWLVKTNPESLPIIPIISPIVIPPLTITTTSEPVSTSEIPPETTSETSPSTTMESKPEKVPKEEGEAAGIPGFMTFPTLLALIVVVLVFRKHQK